MRFNKGSALAQYGIILALIALALVPVFFLLGNNIRLIFEDYTNCFRGSNTAVADASGSALTTSSTSSGTGETSNSSALSGDSIVENNISYNDDGSITFNHNGKNINLPPRLVELSSLVVETAGTNGTEQLIEEIEYLLKTYEAENPGEEPSIEIAFGSSRRKEGTVALGGTAEISAASIKVGNKMVILQTDQSCTANNNDCSSDVDLGMNKIEATLADGETDFKINPGSSDLIRMSNHGSLSMKGTVDSSDGLVVDLSLGSVNWNIDFSNPDNKFSL